jgi:hypothetical protein
LYPTRLPVRAICGGWIRSQPSLALRLKPSWYRSRIATLGKEFTWNKH